MSGRSEFIAGGGHTVCLHEDRWDTILKKLENIEKKLDHHHYRMFVDNGSPSIQTCLQQGVARFSDHEKRIVTLEEAPARILGIAALVTGIGSAIAAGVVWAVNHLSIKGGT
jgi:hypothetical protein